MRLLLTLALFATPMLAGCFQEEALNTPTPVAPEAADNAEQAVAVEEPETEIVKAEAGVTGKGDYGRGVIATPLSTLWTVREQAAYDIQIPKNLSLYKAMNGKGPQSTEEFMTEIIEKGMIKLPELPEGHTYLYDVELEELQVHRPVE